MSLRTNRGYRLLLWLLTIACLSGAGYLGYQTFFAQGSAARTYKAAEAAYTQGLAAYGQKNWKDASLRFDEATQHSNNALKQLKEQAEAGKISPEELKPLNGKIMWVKARAIRDMAFSKAQEEGKPIQEDNDLQYNEMFRSFMRIPDEASRIDAISALRVAGDFLGEGDPEVLKESLRLELSLPTIQWEVAEPQLRLAVKKDSSNARAQYYLALYEFSQPDSPAADDKKIGERVEKAREHLNAARKDAAIYWRTAGLEAEILDWTRRTGAARRLKPDAIATAERSLEALLFTPQTGAIAQAQSGEHLNQMGRADGPGLVSVLRIAMERAVADARKPGGRADRVRFVARASVDLANKMADDPRAKIFFLPAVLGEVARIATAAQPYFAKSDPAAWRAYVADMQAVFDKAGEGARAMPEVKFQLAAMGLAEAMIADRAGNREQARTMRDKALAQAEDGLKSAEAAKLSAEQIDNFHIMLAEWKLMSGIKTDAVESHLARLRNSTLPKAKLLAQFLDAVVAERQGKLDRARTLLMPLAANTEHPDLARRANLILANLQMVLGNPAAALIALRAVEPMYRQLDELPAIERAWHEELGRGTLDDNLSMQIRANLEVARQIAVRYRAENPKGPIPGELIETNLKNARDLLKRLRPPSGADRLARLAFVNFNLMSGRKNEADAMLAELASDYPDSVDVLRARCIVLSAPDDSTAGAPNANGIAAADVLIRKFLKEFPADRAGQLFYAEWLVRTERADRAIEFLKDPANFPGGRDAAVSRILGAALLRTGQREEAQKILASIPHDPRLDAVLIQTAVTREAGERQLKDALNRYENQGRFRIYEAAQKLRDRKFAEAIQGFVSAIEFTEVSASAKAGLVLALGAYASAEPVKAKDAIMRLIAEMPGEPGLYLAAGEAALLLNDVGDPADKWESTKTMYAAVNKWEEVALKSGQKRSDLIPTKVRARLMAGDPEGARREATKYLASDPDHATTMLLLAELYLMQPVDTARARELYDMAANKKPNDPALPMIDARIKEVTGDWVGSIAVYQKLVTESPRAVAPRIGLVTALVSAGKLDEALRQAKEWHAKMPDDLRAGAEVIRLLCLTGKKSDAIKAADAYVAAQVEDARKRVADNARPLTPAEADKLVDDARASALLRSATAFFGGKAFEEAEARVLEVIKGRPKSIEALMLLGDIAVTQKQWDKAVTVYRQVLGEDPRNFIAGNNLAWVLAEHKNDPATALAVVTEIRKGRTGETPIGPERLPADFLDTIGVVYVKLKDPERFAEMRLLFEGAVKRYPTDPRMHLYLGHARAASGERSKALESFDTAIRLAKLKNSLPEDQNKAVISSAEEALKKLRT